MIHVNDNSQCSLTFSTASGYLSGGILAYHNQTATSNYSGYQGSDQSSLGSFPVPNASAGNVGGESTTMSLWIHNATSNLGFPTISGSASGMDASGNASGGHYVGCFKSKQILTAMKITPDAGTITSGRMSLYGIAHA